jgi:exodeoxyribonuclease VII small subunit
MSNAGAVAGAISDDDDLEALTFEQLLARLEGVTAQLADGDLGIEAAADLYERARVLHAAAGERLERVSRRIAALEPGETHDIEDIEDADAEGAP